MRVGTKSLLWGGHAFWLHPFILAEAWFRLFGFPWDPRLWACFFLHDAGYIGSPNMDGPEGQDHVLLGARIMRACFGGYWESFCLRHSRYWCRRRGQPPSRLCVADKLAFVITPAWLYLPMTRATGELDEYIERVSERRADGEAFTPGESRLLASADERQWLCGLKSHTRSWVEAHRDAGEDTGTVRPIEQPAPAVA